jgi:hypothetical protein
VLLVRDDAAPMAVLDVGLSLVAGGLAVALGVWVTRAVVHRVDVATFDPQSED